MTRSVHVHRGEPPFNQYKAKDRRLLAGRRLRRKTENIQNTGEFNWTFIYNGSSQYNNGSTAMATKSN